MALMAYGSVVDAVEIEPGGGRRRPGGRSVLGGQYVLDSINRPFRIADHLEGSDNIADLVMEE